MFVRSKEMGDYVVLRQFVPAIRPNLLNQCIDLVPDLSRDVNSSSLRVAGRFLDCNDFIPAFWQGRQLGGDIAGGPPGYMPMMQYSRVWH